MKRINKLSNGTTTATNSSYSPQRRNSNGTPPAPSHNLSKSPRTSVQKPRDKVEVMCRFRPLIGYELDPQGAACVTFVDDRTVLVKGEKRDTPFTFDRVFNTYSTQPEIFEHVGKPAVEDVLKGYNATIFAYGQTSAGKTYTMMSMDTSPQFPLGKNHERRTDAPHQRNSASNDRRGVGPRIVDALFDAIDKAVEDIEFTVKVSFFEIYMERVNDLLAPSKVNLTVKEDIGRGFFVSDLTEIYVASETDVYKLIEYGNSNKQMGVTNMNKDSSRSHTILALTITQNNIVKGEKTSAKLYIVDLAGSEKVRRTNASGMQLEEAKSINQSLATLGKVINALTDGSSTHIPYRESKLTKLLQDAVGGNSRTTLLINCSPSSFNHEETLSTLRFGTSAKLIRNKPKVNYEASSSELERKLAESQKIIHDMQLKNATLLAEIDELKLAKSHNEAKMTNVNVLVQEITKKDEVIQILQQELEGYQLREEQMSREYNTKIATLVMELQETKDHVTQLTATNEQLKLTVAKTSSKLKASTQFTQESAIDSKLQSVRQAAKQLLTQILQDKEGLLLEQKQLSNSYVSFQNNVLEVISKLAIEQGQLSSTQEQLLDKLTAIPEVKEGLQRAAVEDSFKEEPSKGSEELRDDLISLDSFSTQELTPERDMYKEIPSTTVDEPKLQQEESPPKTSNSNKLHSKPKPRSRSSSMKSNLELKTRVVVPLKPGFKELQKKLNFSPTIKLGEPEASDSEDSSDDENSASVMKCGYVYVMEKQDLLASTPTSESPSGDSKRKLWHKKWCVLPQKSTSLRFYKNLRSLRAVEIQLQGATVAAHDLSNEDFLAAEQECYSFKVISAVDQQVLYFKVSTEEEQKDWIDAITVAIRQLDEALVENIDLLSPLDTIPLNDIPDIFPESPEQDILQ